LAIQVPKILASEVFHASAPPSTLDKSAAVANLNARSRQAGAAPSLWRQKKMHFHREPEPLAILRATARHASLASCP